MPDDAPLYYLYVNGPKPPPVVVLDRRIGRGVCVVGVPLPDWHKAR